MNRFNFYLLENGSPRQYASTIGSTEMKENKELWMRRETMIQRVINIRKGLSSEVTCELATHNTGMV